MEPEFNLIDEPWILVRNRKGGTEEVSLRTLFTNAHTYAELAGETKTQDFAVLRMLLALIYTVFSRYGPEGTEIDLAEDPDLIYDNWLELWRKGAFPMEAFEAYFSIWYDRFWLFSVCYPFGQSNSAKGKSFFSTPKMIGTLFESANKPRLFSARSGDGRELSFSEGARWLIHLNCFDDRSAKQPVVPQQTWTSKLSLIALQGGSLFETLLLNWRAEYDAQKNVFHEEPSWETETDAVAFNRLIPVPDNQAALLSLMNRRLLLCRTGDRITGVYIAGGDYFEEVSVFDEQMTMWRGFKKKKDEPFRFEPRIYEPSKQFWREFESLAVLSPEHPENDAKEGRHTPGILSWFVFLQKRKWLRPDTTVRILCSSVIYNYNQRASLPVLDVVSDELTLHAQMYSDLAVGVRSLVCMEIKNCTDAAAQVQLLAKRLQFAVGRRDKDNSTVTSFESDAKARYYVCIDRPFRKWLSSLDAGADLETAASELETELLRISVHFGEELTGDCGSEAIFGQSGGNDASAAKAMNVFFAKMKKIWEAGDKNE